MMAEVCAADRNPSFSRLAKSNQASKVPDPSKLPPDKPSPMRSLQKAERTTNLGSKAAFATLHWTASSANMFFVQFAYTFADRLLMYTTFVYAFVCVAHVFTTARAVK